MRDNTQQVRDLIRTRAENHPLGDIDTLTCKHLDVGGVTIAIADLEGQWDWDTLLQVRADTIERSHA